jgi:hypothetical protein
MSIFNELVPGEDYTPSQRASVALINETVARYKENFDVLDIDDIILSLGWILSMVAYMTTDNPQLCISKVSEHAGKLLIKQVLEKLQ